MIWTMPFNSETSLRIMADCERTRITIARVKAIFDHFWRQQGHWPLLQWPAWEQGQSPPASIGCIPMKCPEEGASGDPVLAGNPVTDPMVAGVCLSAPSAAIEPPGLGAAQADWAVELMSIGPTRNLALLGSPLHLRRFLMVVETVHVWPGTRSLCLGHWHPSQGWQGFILTSNWASLIFRVLVENWVNSYWGIVLDLRRKRLVWLK